MAERITLVPFFITTQRASHDSQGAFIQVLFEQLSALLGESAPSTLPEATIETTLLEWLSRAAIAQDQTGRRLVLVVDGLDEDRGAAGGPDAQSIAGMLPARLPGEGLPGGMRVIAASRPNPPLPGDVPPWHPLRDPSVIRPLSPHRDARRFQELARSELRHFLAHGSETERDLLGFLTAARGGLSASDLAWLAEIALWEAEAFLDTGKGSRMLRGRPGLVAAPRSVFLLGHDELYRLAEDYFDGRRLDRYRERLNSWAAHWHGKGWPPDTPEYLLIDYFQFLDELGDLTRMTECARDAVRHNRVLALTGGDAAALAEARTALNRIAAQDTPDLAIALALACHRDHLKGRGTRVPAALPAVWAALGQIPRALALADSFTRWPVRVKALAQIAGALAETGQHQEAMRIAEEVEAIAWTLIDDSASEMPEDVDLASERPEYADLEENGVLVEVAKALARAGKHQNAVSLARAASLHRASNDAGWDRSALDQVALILAETCQYRQFIDPDRDFDASGMAAVAGALAGAGQHQEAMRIAKKAEARARAVMAGTPWKAEALADVANALARLGKHRRAAVIVEMARDIALTDTLLGTYGYNSWNRMMRKVSGALARCGRYPQALDLARTVDERVLAEILTEIAIGMAEAGQYQDAVGLASDMVGRNQRGMRLDKCLAKISRELARCGEYPRALHVADSITGLNAQLMVLADVGQVLARVGQYQQAMGLAIKVEAIARGSDWQSGTQAEIARGPVQNSQQQDMATVTPSDQVEVITRAIGDPAEQMITLAEVAGALTEVDRYAEARGFADAINDLWSRAWALTEIAEALARAGQQEEAAAIAEEAQAIGNRLDYGQREIISRRVACALAWSGEQQRALAIVAKMRARGDRGIIDLLAEFAAALAWNGNDDQAMDMAAQVESMALEFEEGVAADSTVEAVAGALTWTGQYEQAMDVAREITNPYDQSMALAAVARGLAWTGLHERAIDIARKIPASYTQSKALAAVARGLARTGGNRSSAMQAVAMVCAAEDWTISVRPVLELIPSAFEMLVRVLREQPLLPHE